LATAVEWSCPLVRRQVFQVINWVGVAIAGVAANPGGTLQTTGSKTAEAAAEAVAIWKSITLNVSQSINGDCVNVHQFESVFKELVDVTSCCSISCLISCA
jgi:hypothetical protein